MNTTDRNTLIADIRRYFVETIENYELRADLAYDTMANWRCPLDFADSRLYNEMDERLIEFCEDDGLDYEEIFNEISLEEYL